MPGDKFIRCVIDYSYKGLLLTHEGCLLSNRLKNTELGLVGTKRQQAHVQTILLKTERLMTDKNIHCWFIACSVGMRTKRSTRSLISSVRQDELYSGTVAQIQEIPNRFGCPVVIYPSATTTTTTTRRTVHVSWILATIGSS